MTGNQTFGPSSAAFPRDVSREGGLEIQQLGHKPVPIWIPLSQVPSLWTVPESSDRASGRHGVCPGIVTAVAGASTMELGELE